MDMLHDDLLRPEMVDRLGSDGQTGTEEKGEQEPYCCGFYGFHINPFSIALSAFPSRRKSL
jgi:hypothetical protein